MDPYVSSFLHENDDFLAGLRAYALDNSVPVLRPDSASLLSTLTALKKPCRILEAGSAIGYSAILMAKAAPDTKIETVEIDPDMAGIARANIAKAGFGDRIRVILGDASDVFPALSGNFDMIFLDSAKGQYVRLLDDVVRLLSPGGLLVADNCIFYGKVYDDPASAPHKHRTIVANMRSFLERVLCGNEFQGTLLETGDGMLVAVRREGK
ncbi:MAG: O-methyltransferase [Clostridia bacterium]|nr:O-methyltransferase [Clostridia bacterium]